MYRALELNLEVADNAVEAGIYEVWERISTGRMKVFSTLQNWRFEYLNYIRDENGKILRQDGYDDNASAQSAFDLLRSRSLSGCRPGPPSGRCPC